MRTGPVTKNTSTVALGLAQIRVGSAAANIASTTPVLTSAHSIGALANTKYTGKVDFWKLESGFPMLEDMTIPMRESAALECAFKEITPYNMALARGLDPNGAVDATVAVLGNSSAAGTTTGNITVVAAGPDVVNDTFTIVVEAVGFDVTYSVYGQVSGKVLDSVDDSAPQTPATAMFTIPAGYFSGVWLADETLTFKTTQYVAAAGAYSDPHAGSINLGSMKAPDYVRMEAVYTYPNQVNHMYIIFPRANVTSSMEIDLKAEDNANVPITFEGKRADSEVAGGSAVWDNAPLGTILWD